MVLVNGFTKEHMLAIKNGMIVGADIVGDELILTKFDESTLNLGSVRGPAGTNGTNGADGDEGPQGPPGTAGLWINGTIVSINPVNAGYQNISVINIPTAAYARHVNLWASIVFQAVGTDVTIYRGSIRDTANPGSTSQKAWIPPIAAKEGGFDLSTGPIPLGANVSKNYELRIRREKINDLDPISGGKTEDDVTLTRFFAFVTAD